MTFTLGSLSGKLFISISLELFFLFFKKKLFKDFLSITYFFVFSFCLTFYVCFYKLCKTAISLDLEEVALYRSDICVDCVCWVILAGWLEPKLASVASGATKWLAGHGCSERWLRWLKPEGHPGGQAGWSCNGHWLEWSRESCGGGQSAQTELLALLSRWRGVVNNDAHLHLQSQRVPADSRKFPQSPTCLAGSFGLVNGFF